MVKVIKKRVFAMLMTLAMVISLMPALTISAHAEATTETFESCATNATSFTSSGKTFSLDPSTGFKVNTYNTYGYNSSNNYIDNMASAVAAPNNTLYRIMPSPSSAFCVKSLYLYPSAEVGGNTNQTSSVGVTFTGKLGGTTKFTYSPNSSLFSSASYSNTTNRGFSLVDFSVPALGYENTAIDELQITLSGTTVYFAIDNFTWDTAEVAPTVTTQAVSSITATTATGNGNVTALGSPKPTAYGVCWNTTGAPTISDNKVTNGAKSSPGAFTAAITGLTAATKYYVRAYATNSADTCYGEEVNFTTAASDTGTVLSTGDIVILEFNGNGADGFTFMPLVDLAAGTIIHFTDYGWNGSAFQIYEEGNSPAGGGNMITYTAPSIVAAGTLIRQNTANIGGAAFTVDAEFSAYNFNNYNYISALNSLSTGHDGILAFQGSISSPTFLWAYHTGQWGKGAYEDNYWSDLPTGLSNGTNAVYFADNSGWSDVTVDDGYYSGVTTSANAAVWRERVANSANWTTSASGTAPTLLYPNAYTVTAPNAAPTVTTPATVSYTDTSASDSFSNTTGTLSATDDGSVSYYGISGETGCSYTDNSITYNEYKDGTYGRLYVQSATGKYVFVPSNTAINAVSVNQSETFTVSATDNLGATGNATLTVSITGVNDAPTLTATALNPTYTENGGSAALFNGITVSSIESGQKVTELILTVSNVSEEEDLLILDGGNFSLKNGTGTTGTGIGYSVSLVGGTSTITLSKADGFDAQSVIAWLYYRNTSDNPTTAAGRVVTLKSIKDNGGGTDTTTLTIASTVNVVAVNDAPTVTNSTKTADEDTTLTFTAADFTGYYSDIESSALSAVRIETLPSAAQGKLKLSGVDMTAAQVVTAANLGNITFVPALNFSGNATFTWKASDGTDYSASAATMTLSVNAANDTPTDIALSASSVNENVAGDTTVGTLSSTDPDDGNTFTYTLVAGTGDTDNGSFNISGSSLRITNSPNYETKSSYTVRIRTTDQGGLWFEKAFTVAISNVNETPTDMELSASSVNENVGGNTSIGSLSSTDPDAGNTFTYTLVSGAGATDNGAFNIDGNNLRITNSPNYEAKSSYTVRVRSTDQGGLWYEEAYTITINNVNEAPTDIALSASAINENVAVDTTVGTLSSTDPDAANTFTYTLVAGSGDTDNSSFDIVGNALKIKLSPDRETKSSYSVRVRSIDQGSQSFDKAFTITINNVNEAPTNISLSSASVSESSGVGTTVGNLITTDPDAADTFTYELIAGDGSGDNASFTIDAGVLKTNTTFNYATKNSYSIRVKTTDAGSLTSEKALTVTITETNHAPTDIGLTATSIDENLAANSTVGTLSTTDANTWDTFTYTLVAGSGDTDNASFNILGNALRLTGSGNYEAKSSYSVRIRATDIGGLWYEEAYTITINNVNEDPTDITLSASSVNENVAGNTTVGTLSSTDSDVGSTFTYSLVSGTGDTDNGAFSIDGSSLRITNSPDYETKNSYSVRVRTKDQTNLWYEEVLTITINNINETPTDIALSVSSVNENVAGDTAVGTLSSIDPDPGNTFTYTLVAGTGDTDNGSFNISGGSLRITNSPNYETKSSYTVRVRTTDQGDLWYEEAYTITINNVNETPTDMELSANSVDENVAGNTSVGSLSSTDPDASNTFTYTLVSGAGATDNDAFNIDGNNLRITNSPNYEAKSSYTVRVRSTDQGGLWYEEAYTITINNVNEDPTDITLSASSVNENVAGNTTVGTLSSTDSDAGSTFTYSLVSGTGSTDNGAFSIDGSSLRITNSPNYEAKNSYTVRVRSTDQDGLWYEEAFTINISNVNEVPVISTGNTVSVVEGTTAAFTGAASDPEGSAITWSITGGADSAKFIINSGTGAVTFVTAPSFSTPTDTDTNNSYVLEITASDGALSAAKTVTVTVTQAVYDTPSTPTSAVVEVNGEKQDAGQTATQTTEGTTTTTITVDDAKLNNILEQKGNNATVTLPVSGTPDVVVGELTGQTVKNMEQKEAVLEIKTESITYTLPASQINIDAVSSQLGTQVELKDIKVSVKIAEPSADTVKIVENTASKGNYQLVVKPIEFEITCTSGNNTVEVNRFNGYVERTVAIPEGIDPSKITTGIVLNSDGTFSHVPTSIVVINGKYFAKINSLTNSTYSVIYNPVEFTDVENHWAKDAVNDMGSRMVVTGIGGGIYEPDRSITRAEFAAIVVRAMGLKKGTTESAFGDVTLTDWFNGYVDTATAYSLITGYSSESFAPNDTITREQAMTILARAMKLTGLSVTLTDSETSALLASYTDAGLISDYAKAGAAECVKTGVVSGTTTTTLSPKDSVTRAEVAAMVQRLLKKSGLI